MHSSYDVRDNVIPRSLTGSRSRISLSAQPDSSIWQVCIRKRSTVFLRNQLHSPRR